MDAQGEQIGIVTEVDPDAQIAYVEPDPDLAEARLQGLGFGDADGTTSRSPPTHRTITDSELRVLSTVVTRQTRDTRPRELPHMTRSGRQSSL